MTEWERKWLYVVGKFDNHRSNLTPRPAKRTQRLLVLESGPVEIRVCVLVADGAIDPLDDVPFST